MCAMNKNILQEIERSGFPYRAHLIQCFIGGSELHGAKVNDADDMDIYGVYVEPPELVLGLDRSEHFVWSTAGDERRNGPDDVDVTLYCLHKRAGLAVKGNPTALHFLFAGGKEEIHPVWKIILDNRECFLSRDSATQFLGFADDQLKRTTGEKGRGKKGQRPELEERFGYDTKAAMHTLRLLYECIELMREGRISFPRPEKELLISVRTGIWSLEQLVNEAAKIFDEARAAQQSSKLPKSLNRSQISRLVTGAYLRHWSELDLNSRFHESS
jgi:predicted nucleotidyltransferase